ncbi:hypothetical protein BKA70DRAFT_715324 [Coprinopsis sp. MPI-PUGE-AT-0042]|nr:hypothetical protein BKA70DRAFT_715324 [Coprinopsis sp. MPI-PUGE-AT-0042]
MSHENRRVPITTLLLQKYYQSVVDLQTYVLSIVDVPAICNEGDNESYMAFVKNTVVATNLAIGKEPRFIVQDVNYDMGEVVQQAQKTISKRTGDASKNVLALGCTSVRARL